MKLLQLKPFFWIAYPVGVLVLIIISISLTVGGENQVWTQLLQKQQDASNNQKTLTRLNTKLAALKQVNSSQMTQDLSWMLQVMPDKKQFDSMVNELRFAAQSSGSILVSYKAQSGSSDDFTLVAQFTVPDFNSSQKLIATLQNTLPLLSVTDVTFSDTNLSLSVSSAWAPVITENVKIDDPLPDSISQVSQLENAFSSYQVPMVTQVVSNSSDSGQIVVPVTDPFGSLPGSN